MRPIRRAGMAALAGLIALFAARAVSVGAQQPSDNELARRIAALEEGQKAILRELQLLRGAIEQSRPAPPPPGGGPIANTAPTNTAKPVAPPPQIPNFDLTLAGSPSKGNASAKLVLLEFSDFECPFCGRYTRDTHDQVIKEFVDTGKIRYVFRHLPIESLHPRALRASEAAECAYAQGKFWEYHKVLFNNQQALNEPDFARHAQFLGLNATTFQQCMATQLKSPTKVRQDQNEGGRAGITGTPTFFIGTVTKEGKLKVLRRLVGAHPITNFRTTIETLLAETK